METTTFEELSGKGYKIRPAQMDDLEQAVAMFNACSEAMTGAPEFTVERYRREWLAPGFNLEEDTRLVLTAENQIVGCIEIWTLLDPPVHPWVWARVHPEFEGQGIGTAMMTWGKERAYKAAIRRVPEGIRIAMYSGTIASHAPSKDLLEGFGMDLLRQNLRMQIELSEPLPDPAWPEGIRVRAYRHPDDSEATYRAQIDAFEDHWGYIETPFEQGFQQWLHFNVDQESFNPSLWYLALDGDQIAGIALCQPQADDDPDLGWVEVLGVLRPWRGQGLGLALLHHSFNAFHERGQYGVGLGVDAQSLTGATRLYEKAGMHVERHYSTYELQLRSGRELRKQSLEQ